MTDASPTTLISILSQAMSSHASASDILIKEGTAPWARVNGDLLQTNAGTVTKDILKKFIQDSAPKTQLTWELLEKELDSKGDADFAVDVPINQTKVRFRVNYYRSNGKRHCMALRKLPDTPIPLETMGFTQSFTSLLSQAKGLILVTGPTGSGKTTTLAAAISQLNKTVSGHIITLEDPVEYIIKSDKCLVDQREIGRDAKDFKSGLRAALRQDPDILLVGELRDQETVKVALDAASTGHLVLGTLHTNSAQQTIERLTSFFTEDRREWAHEVLAQVLLGISSQVLIKRKDKPGQIMAAEVLIGTSAVKSLIREKATSNIFNQMDTGAREGHVLMNRALINLAKKGIIDIDDAKFATYDLKNFELELSRAV